MTEDIIDDPKLNACSGDEFRCYFRLLAMLNRTKSRDGKLVLDRFGLMACTMRAQVRHSERTVSALEAHGLCTLTAEGVHYVITVPKWPELQYPLREHSEKTPSPKTTPKTTPKTKKKDRTSRSASSPKIDPRTPEAWTEIRAAFAAHGRPLSEALGADRAALISKRLEAGASPEELVRAVHGYVRQHGGLEPQGDFDPGRYFTPRTVFKAEGFSDRVDLGADASLGKSKISRIMARAGQ